MAHEGYWGRMPQSERSLAFWMPRLMSAEQEYGPQRDVVAGRARDLAVNSAYGANAIRVHRDNVIGLNFNLSLRLNAGRLKISSQQATEWQREAERQWRDYSNSTTFDCDAQRVQTFTWLMHTAYATFLMSGESLALLKWKPSHSGFNTCMLLIEPERLSQPLGQPETRNFRRGIETDDDGAPIRYWIREMHPTDPIMWNPGGRVLSPLKWTPAERATGWGRPIVLHMVDRLRPDMRRGISMFAAAASHIKRSDSYDAAELEAALLQASFAAVIKTELPRDQVMDILGAKGGIEKGIDGKPVLDYMANVAAPWAQQTGLEVGGARITHLLPGESLDLVKPESPGLAYEAFQTAVLRKTAAALGTSYESLSRDFSKMSFAAAKTSLADVFRSFLRARELICRQLGIPFVAAWMEEAIETGRLPMPNGKRGDLDQFAEIRPAIFANSTFLSWGAPHADPTKERQGQKMAMDSNLSTLQLEAQQEGLDWEDLLEQKAIERQRMEELGIPLPETLNAQGQQPPPDEGAGDGPPAKDNA